MRECPFCGSDKVFAYDIGYPHFVYCASCDARVVSHKPGKAGLDEAMDRWNSRPSMRPMRIEDLDTVNPIPCWVEDQVASELFPAVLDYSCGIFKNKFERANDQRVSWFYSLESYGVTWRAWPEKPSSRERSRAKRLTMEAV